MRSLPSRMSRRFLDTPIKRYSSGMYMRLAFSVAAHLDPEILIIDEVLAVGDAEFQKKCLGKMGEVAAHGRTLLFVSHNPAAIRALCTKALLMKSGTITWAGSVLDTLARYHFVGRETSSYVLPSRDSTGEYCFLEVALPAVIEGPSIALFTRIASKSVGDLIINIRVKDRLGAAVAMATIGGFTPAERLHITPGEHAYQITIALKGVAAGEYRLSLDLETPFNIFHERLEDCVLFSYSPLEKTAEQRTFHQSWNSGYFLLPAFIQALSGLNV